MLGKSRRGPRGAVARVAGLFSSLDDAGVLQVAVIGGVRGLFPGVIACREGDGHAAMGNW